MNTLLSRGIQLPQDVDQGQAGQYRMQRRRQQRDLPIESNPVNSRHGPNSRALSGSVIICRYEKYIPTHFQGVHACVSSPSPH